MENTTITYEQFSRLPKWAQHEFTRLRAELHNARIAAGQASPDRADFYAASLSSQRRDYRPIAGRYDRTVWSPDEDPNRQQQQGFLTLATDKGSDGSVSLSVSAPYGTIVVEPCAPNHVRVRVVTD